MMNNLINSFVKSRRIIKITKLYSKYNFSNSKYPTQNINFGNVNKCEDLIELYNKKRSNLIFDNKFKIFNWYLYLINYKDTSYEPMNSNFEINLIKDIKRELGKSRENDEYDNEKIKQIPAEQVTYFINNFSWLKSEALSNELDDLYSNLLFNYNFKNCLGDEKMFKFILISIANRLAYYSKRVQLVDDILNLDSLCVFTQNLLSDHQSLIQVEKLSLDIVLTILYIIQKFNNNMNGYYNFYLSIAFEKMTKEGNLKQKIFLLFTTSNLGHSCFSLEIKTLIENLNYHANKNYMVFMEEVKALEEYCFHNLIYSLVYYKQNNLVDKENFNGILKYLIKILYDEKSVYSKKLKENLKSNQISLILILINSFEANFIEETIVVDLLRLLDSKEYKLNERLYKFIAEESQKSNNNNIANGLSICNKYLLDSIFNINKFSVLNFTLKFNLCFNLIKYYIPNAFILLDSLITPENLLLLLSNKSRSIDFILVINQIYSNKDHKENCTKILLKFLKFYSEFKLFTLDSHPNWLFFLDYMKIINLLNDDTSNDTINKDVFIYWLKDLSSIEQSIILNSNLDCLKLLINKKTIRSNFGIIENQKEALNLIQKYYHTTFNKQISQRNQLIHNKKIMVNLLYPKLNKAVIYYPSNNTFGINICLNTKEPTIFNNIKQILQKKFTIELEIIGNGDIIKY